jgi:hypothetical protein
MNPIVAKNNTIVTMHLDDEECGSKRLVPNDEFHGDDTSSLHQVAPTPLSVWLVFISLSTSCSGFLKTEHDIKLMAASLSMSIREIDLPLM